MMESESIFSSSEVKKNTSNIPEYSVSDISGAIKRALEGTFGRVRIRGEITELKRYASGHVYLSLKDDGGKISAVIWRGKISHLGLVPENGMEVIATGRVSSYGERSSYQLIVDRMEFAGEGALLARIERLRLQLRQEGVFDLDRKKPLPFLPQYIGVITSRSGAVLHDICTTISRRFPRNILVWPVAVQGDGAVPQIISAIKGMAELPKPPDVLIVARGGGGLEDLMAFNDEAVVRAVAACPLPIISAVGHETDTTLIDYVSDRRAPTPTAAAELAVPLRSELMADLSHRTARLSGGFSAVLQKQKMRLQQAISLMPDLPNMLDTERMRLDDRSQRLELSLPSFVMKARVKLGGSSYYLPSFETLLNRRRTIVEKLSSGLDAGCFKTLQRYKIQLLESHLRIDLLFTQVSLQKTRLEGIIRHLEAVSPQAILKRGYTIVQDCAGKAITHSEQAPKKSTVMLYFTDGVRKAQLDPKEADNNLPKTKARDGRRCVKKDSSIPQGELKL